MIIIIRKIKTKQKKKKTHTEKEPGRESVLQVSYHSEVLISKTLNLS